MQLLEHGSENGKTFKSDDSKSLDKYCKSYVLMFRLVGKTEHIIITSYLKHLTLA